MRTELAPFSSAVGAIRVMDVRGVDTLIAADQHGLMRVWDMGRPGLWTTEIHIGSGINGFAVDPAGRVCVATDMGVVALSLTEVRP
ncbi:hypothetical protein ACFWIB_07655 [Streptomyces sp. NPDC127051]|uniref:hypothetical protein n=1 Tax=Streptomyces sp. NPDC127051 TaxID=3347119 RepID=UPI0036607D6C